MGDDYAKLAGLTEEEDLNEPTIVSMKKETSMVDRIVILRNGSILSCWNV